MATTLVMRFELSRSPGTLGRLATVIGEAGGDIGAVDLVRVGRHSVFRDITVSVPNEEGARRLVDAVRRVEGVKLLHVSDRTFLLHLGGKIEVRSRIPVKTREELSHVYTPGVAKVAEAIFRHPENAFRLTVKRNAVAVVTDGSAVLGLGKLGPLAALPVMEGKCLLFKIFGGVDAFPLCLEVEGEEEFVRVVEAVSPVFGAVNLEDVAAPSCFRIEEELGRRLDIPVFHDDQHGTAVVVLAALENALRLVGKRFSSSRFLIVGAGAAGTATAYLLLAAGAGEVVVADRRGALYPERPDLEEGHPKWHLALKTNPRKLKGSPRELLRGMDVFIGLSAPGVMEVEDIRSMARDPVVFALANPDPEVDPRGAEEYAAVVATGRSDYPNQVNNALCFPGFFRGLLDSRAREVNVEMKLAAARALAGCVPPEELAPDYIVPSIFDRRVPEQVAQAVAEAARKTGAARR